MGQKLIEFCLYIFNIEISLIIIIWQRINIRVQIIMKGSDDENSSNQDLSISFDQQQFNKIYTNQLRKKQKQKQKQKDKDKQRQNEQGRGKGNGQNSSERQWDEISNHREGLSFHEQENQPIKQQHQKQPKWHIYNSSNNLVLNEGRFSAFILQLPIFKKKQKILNQIINNQVILVTGETGCGKSTQVPRLLYEYIRQTQLPAKIICVQPRRLAVKNLHKLLSDQIPEKGAVGYHIAMQTNITQDTKILFMTNGIFLQRLVHGTQFFEQYPFIILDEVHERDIDTDFVLLSIKRIVRKHAKLRIILMSATIDNKLFQYYFAEDEIDNFLTRENYYKRFIKLQEKRMINTRQEEEQEYGYKVQRFGQEQQLYKDIEMQYLKSKIPCPTINVTEKGKYTKKYFYLDSLHQFTQERVNIKCTFGLDFKSPTLNKQLYIVACSIIEQILNKTTGSRKSQSVLLFLPGLGQIEQLATQIQIHFRQKSSNFEIIKCHSSILNDQVTQKLHQQFPKKFKLIIATNIAESSITVFGIKYVIDFCLTKEIYFNQKSRMENLELVWASKASCEQRAGRTGRVCDGLVFRLVDKRFFEKFADYSTPQIQRSSLDKLILRIKLIHQTQKRDKLFEDPGEVLGTAIQPPNLKNIDESIKSLILCGGIKIEDDKLILTKLGRIYVDIPLDIIYSKMLIFAMLMGTYEDVLILVCILSQNKNAFRKHVIQKNPIEYYEVMSNQERCDFLSLVMAYKKKKSKIDNREYRNSRNEVQLDIYYETKLLIEDVSRRIRQRNFIKKIYPDETKEDYFEKFKFTIAFGFLTNFIKVRPMVYDDKQEKRYKLMRRFGITVKNTVVLLNSQVIRKQNNQSVNERVKQTWINNISKIFRIDRQKIGMTLGDGLSYLHFKQEIDLNKFLFVNHMEKRKKEERSAYKHEKNKLSQILSLLGDIDYMEEGHTVEIHKQNKVTIDQFSSNRIIPVDKQNQSYQFPATRYALTNCITIHNLRLSCRFVSLLPDVKHIQLLLHLLFYPFASLHPDKKRTRYNYLLLKKRGRMSINYELNDEQIERANQIRGIIKELMQLHLFVEQQVDFDVIEPMRVTEDGRVIETERDEQAPQFSGRKKYGSKSREPGIRFDSEQKRGRMVNEESELVKRQYNDLTFKNQERVQKMKKFWPMLKQFLLKERKGIVEQQRWQQLYFQQKKIEQKFSKVKVQKEEPQQYMNQIKNFDLRFSYFSSNYQYPLSREQRIKDYEKWKLEKYKSIVDLENLATDHDPYIVCSECKVKIAKLNKIGPINGVYFRQLFEYYEDNVVKLPYNQLGDFFCSMIMTIHLEKQYNVYGCKNNHIFAVRFQDQRKLKILNFSPISILYTDGTMDLEPQFEKIQYKFWRQKYERAKVNKMKKPLQSKCFVCGDKFRNAKEVEIHVKLESHMANVRDFKQTFETKIENKKSAKWEKGGPTTEPYVITSY